MRKRNKRVEVYLTENEYSNLAEKVKLSGMPREAYIRQVLGGVEIKEKPPADFYKLMVEVRKVGSNLNQLVKRAQALNFIDTPALQKVMAEIRETEDMLWDTFQSGSSG